MAIPREGPLPGHAAQAAEPQTDARPAAVRDALARLRCYSSNAELVEHIPAELCQAGFSRVLFSQILHNMWVVRSAHATLDPGLADTLLKAGRAHPRRLCAPLPESAMVRSKKPILVEGPQSDPRVYSDLVAVVRPNVYIAAPIYMWQTPVGLLHADAPSDAGDVSVSDRDLLGVFAEAVGAILERNMALERLRSMRGMASAHSREIHTLTGFSDDDAWSHDEPTRPRERVEDQPDNALRHLVDAQMTRREQQVLQLLAAGKTNAEIADRLFVSAGTVKSHVRHIMQKLDASNRTDAVARYRHMAMGSVEQPSCATVIPITGHPPPLPQKN